jgi:hypothetical protein
LASASRRLAAEISLLTSVSDSTASTPSVSFDLPTAHPPRIPGEPSREERKEMGRRDAIASRRSFDEAIVDGSFVRRNAKKHQPPRSLIHYCERILQAELDPGSLV